MTPLQRGLLFGGYTAGLIAGHTAVLGGLIALARTDASASHVIVVPFLTAALLVSLRHSIAAEARMSWLFGGLVILAGIALRLAAASRGDELSWMVGSLVVLWIGGFVLFYGPGAFRRGMFPLLFLAFMVPLPAAAIDAGTQVLKRGSADAVASLYSMLGTPYHREGFLFLLPGFAVEIADACSGIRSSIALALTALLAGHLFLKTAWAKAVLLLAVLPVTILKNAARIVLLTMLATHVDPKFLAGPLHQEGGIAFFVLALLMLAPLFGVLRRLDSARTSAAPGAMEPDAPLSMRSNV